MHKTEFDQSLTRVHASSHKPTKKCDLTAGWRADKILVDLKINFYNLPIALFHSI